MDILSTCLKEQLLTNYYLIKHLILQRISNMNISEDFFFDKKSSATCTNKFDGSSVTSELVSNQELAKELHKPIIRKTKSILIFERQCLVC